MRAQALCLDRICTVFFCHCETEKQHHSRLKEKKRRKKKTSITLVNTIFLAGKVRLVSGVFKGAESESDIGFFRLALVLEISQGVVCLKSPIRDHS